MEDKKRTIAVGNTIYMCGKKYRILYEDQIMVILIEVGIGKYNIVHVSTEYMLYSEASNIYDIKDEYGAKHIVLSEDDRNLIKAKKEKIEEILTKVFPDYSSLQAKKTVLGISEYAEQFGCSIPTVHKDIRRYLQAGRDMFALVDGRKKKEKKLNDFFSGGYRGNHILGSGKKRIKIDPEIEKKQFEEAFKMLQSGKCQSVEACYQAMIAKHYLERKLDENGTVQPVMVSDEYLPSIGRFRRYVNMLLEPVGVRAYKKKLHKDHNVRQLNGTAQTDVSGPGRCVEIDACELDIIIVMPEDRRQDIGRPVVYFAVDVYSCCIIGYYVGFENNSFLGATSLLNQIFFRATPHKDPNGLDIIPSGFIPDEIRVDHGAEWVSKDLRNLERESQITVNIVSPRTGSLKGIVENAFLEYQNTLHTNGREYGVIYKEYGSRHYDKAALILDDIRDDILDFILYFNQHLRSEYTLTRDMIEKKVPAVPYMLFDYGVRMFGSPIHVTDANKDEIFFSLLKVAEKSSKLPVTLNAKGIGIRGLHYISKDPLFMEMIDTYLYKGERIPYEVRIDPRLVDYVWIRVEGRILCLKISELRQNERTFTGCTWFEYLCMMQDKKEDQQKLKRGDTERKVVLYDKQRKRMATAKASQSNGRNKKCNVRPHRDHEKQKLRSQEALVANDVLAVNGTESTEYRHELEDQKALYKGIEVSDIGTDSLEDYML